MTGKIYLLNGPNLNLLGQRQPELYGADTLEEIAARLAVQAQAAGFALRALQSNHEGQLVDWIQEARQDARGIIINPAAYSHTSIAILDALYAFDGPVIEVHISDIHAREAFRHHSYVSARADEVIIGQGTRGYAMALEKLVARLA
ncbi:type II 3-dehydroquinate dehydratase [Abyssibius alkaniclasticus]|uniref:type II 3-dehydroquinate dehydratase n=1 Tax=Abyssibius alkaniclasticus TaxID=2881234 RepID=UPI00236344A0|nr:type II 3-dehydroquinate dehydratase [Abyssibius alkaniclasticus]UPH72062.1 type II 3-dehydroquinate dehydratase [Abyssibius alkaniclasticus]|tara:strand:- start:801 stop:1238 length:438 start_codon:yes stop_codon:yes gene_type:complete